MNVNFGENDTFASVSRVILQCKSEMSIKIIDWIGDLRKKDQKSSNKNEIIEFTAKDVISFCKQNDQKETLHILRVLIFFGYLSFQS